MKLQSQRGNYKRSYFGQNSRMSRQSSSQSIQMLHPMVQKTSKDLDAMKRKDIKAMLKYIPLLDRGYYKTLGIC